MTFPCAFERKPVISCTVLWSGTAPKKFNRPEMHGEDAILEKTAGQPGIFPGLP